MAWNKKEFDDMGGGLYQDMDLSPNDLKWCHICNNWKPQPDKKSKFRRPGYQVFGDDYDFGGKKVLGMKGRSTGDDVDILVALEDSIRRKAGGEWEVLFSPAETIDQPPQFLDWRGLILISGYEKLITVKDDEAFYSGIEAPTSAPTVKVQSASTGNKELEYPASNQDQLGELRKSNSQVLLAQSFKSTEAFEVSKVVLKLKKIGAPTGNLWVEIHSSQVGTSESAGASSNIVGDESDTIGANSVGAVSFGSYEFEFSGTKPALSANTTYYLVVYGAYTVSTSNFIVVGFDTSDPTYTKGKYWKINNSLDWSGDSTVDMVFEIYGEGTTSGELEAFGARDPGNAAPLRDDSARTMLAQSFKLSCDAEISSVHVSLRKYCQQVDPYSKICPGGNLWVEIHSSQAGTSGTKNTSTNIVGQASVDIDCNSIGEGGPAFYEFSFNGTKPSLSANTTYYLVLYGDFTGAQEIHIRWMLSSGYSDGQNFEINGSMAWSGKAYDHSFKIYGTGTAEEVKAGYDFGNLDDIHELRDHNTTTLLAQSFVAPRSGEVTSLKLYLSKVGAPAGDLWAEIHSAQGGTSGTKNTSANILGQGSDDVAITGLSAFPTYGWVTFTFSGTKPDLTVGNTYYIVLYGTYSVSSSVYVRAGMDKSNPTFENGSRWAINASYGWTEEAHIDMLFELYMAPSTLVGDYMFAVSFIRGGNYPCESNPSPISEKVTIASGEEFKLENIPISEEPEVTGRRLWRVKANGAVLYWLNDLEDNSTTEYVDGMEDGSLGDEVSYENYPPPIGTTIEYWDERLWVAGVPDHPESIFRSGLGTPEQFPSYATSRVPLQGGNAGQGIRLKKFQGNLYVLESKGIWMVRQIGTDSYKLDLVVENIGTRSPASVGVCNKGKEMIFFSDSKKIELFNGYQLTTPKNLSNKIKRLLDGIDEENLPFISGADYPDAGEYRMTITNVDDGASEFKYILVYDYINQEFYLENIGGYRFSSANLVDTSLKKKKFILGTQDGELLVSDSSAVKDAGSYYIVADFQTGWYGSPVRTTLRKIFLNYILPEGKRITMYVYRDFETDPSFNIFLDGNTQGGNPEGIRDVIQEEIRIGLKGSHFSFRFINADFSDRVGVLGMTLIFRQSRAKYKVPGE